MFGVFLCIQFSLLLKMFQVWVLVAPLSHVLMAGPGQHWTGPAPRDPGPESRAGAGRAYYHRRMASSEHQLWQRISRVSVGRQRRRVGKLSGSWSIISLQYCLHLSTSWRHQHFLQDSSHLHLLFLSHNSERIKINRYLVTKRTFKKSNRKSPKESQDSDLSI